MFLWQTDSLSGCLAENAREIQVLMHAQTVCETCFMNEMPAKLLFCLLIYHKQRSSEIQPFLSRIHHQRNLINECICWLIGCFSVKSLDAPVFQRVVQCWAYRLHLNACEAEELFSFHQYFICIKAGTQTLHQQIFLPHVSSWPLKILMTLLIVSITCDKWSNCS